MRLGKITTSLNTSRMSLEHSTLALAGIFQSAELVRQIARQGLIDQSPFENSINSILEIDAPSVEEVYGGLKGVKLGLQVLCNQLETGSKRNLELMRYVLGLILLERKLIKRQDMLKKIRTGIEQALEPTQAITHPDLINHLAHLYLQTLSTFEYRIQVHGEPHFLENHLNADKIRALLLAGIRSAVLWRQKGGNRWQLLFARGRILRFARQYLEKINLLALL